MRYLSGYPVDDGTSSSYITVYYQSENNLYCLRVNGLEAVAKILPLRKKIAAVDECGHCPQSRFEAQKNAEINPAVFSGAVPAQARE